MEINVLDDRKIVEIWLTWREQEDIALREELKPLYREYKAKEYLVDVYLSGTQDLLGYTSDLLCYNRKRIAELEAAQEKVANT